MFKKRLNTTDKIHKTLSMSEYIFINMQRLAMYEIYVDVYYIGIHMNKQSLKKCPKVKNLLYKKVVCARQ